MKGAVRSPIVVVLLEIFTCGLYGLYWMYVVRTEMKDYLEDHSISPGLELLLSIVCFPFFFVWNYKMGRDIARAQEKAGLQPQDQSVLLLVLTFFSLFVVGMFIIQDNLNAVWQKPAGDC